MDGFHTHDANKILATNKIFSGLTDHEISQIVNIGSIVSLNPGDTIFKEGSIGTEIYFILDGQMDVLKADSENPAILHKITSLPPGQSFGEMSIIDNSPRSATMRAHTSCTLLKLTKNDLDTLLSSDKVKFILYQNLASDVASRLRKTNEVTVRALEKDLRETKKQVVVGNFMVSILIILTLFTFSLNLMTQITQALGTSAYTTLSLILITTTVIVTLMIKSGYPRSFYGISLINWKKSVLEGILFSIPVLILATVAKWYIIQKIPSLSQEPLFNFGRSVSFNKAVNPNTVIILGVIYVFISSPLQELIFRGSLQGTLQFFLIGKYRVFLSILTTSLIFAMTHLSFSFSMAVISFLGGILWGWLYARNKTLIAAITSHMLIGGWIFFALGVQNVLLALSGKL